jgi:hypothetical protein
MTVPNGWANSILHFLDMWGDLGLVAESPIAVSFYDVRVECGNTGWNWCVGNADMKVGLELGSTLPPEDPGIALRLDESLNYRVGIDSVFHDPVA